MKLSFFFKLNFHIDFRGLINWTLYGAIYLFVYLRCEALLASDLFEGNKILLCSSAGLELSHPPASAFAELIIQSCVSTWAPQSAYYPLLLRAHEKSDHGSQSWYYRELINSEIHQRTYIWKHALYVKTFILYFHYV